MHFQINMAENGRNKQTISQAQLMFLDVKVVTER